jgi:hypothetical protein
MSRDQIGVADLKLFTRSLNELRYASRTFAPYRQKRKDRRLWQRAHCADGAEFIAAEEFGRKMRDLDYMIITGGGDGIMGAAQKGAGASTASA